MSIETALYTKVTGDATVGGLISTRFYPVHLPQDPTYPAGTYRRVSSNQPAAHDGALDIETARFQTDWYADTYPGVRALAVAVRDCLNCFSGTVGDTHIWSVFVATQQDSFGEAADMWRIIIDFMVQYQRT